LRRTITWMTTSTGPLRSTKERQAMALASLEQAINDLKNLLGNDTSTWVYGQEKLHHVLIKHPMSNAVDEATRATLEVGPLPRGGYGSTPGMTSNSNNQTSGASFRIVADLSDWDKTMFTNAPGQSGDPESPYYRNLFSSWAEDRHFPVYFTRERVDASAKERMTLVP
jgi:penicillin G amidase